MNYNNFDELIEKVNSLNTGLMDRRALAGISDSLVIKHDNYDEMYEFIFSEKFKKFDMKKLPYFIDELFRSDNPVKVLLSSMMLEAVFEDLPFVCVPERKYITKEKYNIIKSTLFIVYVKFCSASGAAAEIISYIDPELEAFSKDQKELIAEVTNDRLERILEYLKMQGGKNSKGIVDSLLGNIVNLACCTGDETTDRTVEEIDRYGFFGTADAFIAKYKLMHKLDLLDRKIKKLTDPKYEGMVPFFAELEKLQLRTKYLKNVTQQDLAMSAMAEWLIRGLGALPEGLECLGEAVSGNERYFVFSFEYMGRTMMSISGGYPADSGELTAETSCSPFHQLVPLQEDWKNQALSIINRSGVN